MDYALQHEPNVGFLSICGREGGIGDHENTVTLSIYKQFVQTAGKRRVKRLIWDRGFLDGEEISLWQEGIRLDILIPIRRNMEIYADAMACSDSQMSTGCNATGPKQETKEPLRLRPKAVSTRDKAAGENSAS